jgi:hypothetical protein
LQILDRKSVTVEEAFIDLITPETLERDCTVKNHQKYKEENQNSKNSTAELKFQGLGDAEDMYCDSPLPKHITPRHTFTKKNGIDFELMR